MLSKIIARLSCILPAIAFSFTSCESVVEIPIPEHTPKLAVRCTIANEVQDSIYISIFPESQTFVSESRSILYGQRPPEVNNATLVITDANGKVVETYEPGNVGSVYQFPGHYKPVSNFKPEPGQYYKLTASAPGFETVTGQLILPSVVNGVQAGFKISSRDPFAITGRLTFTIPDNGTEENYYYLQIMALDSLHQPILYMQIQEEEDETGIGNDIQGIYLTNQYSGILPFDDKTFNGRTLTTSHEISMYPPYYGPDGPVSVKVKYLKAIVSSITKDAFIFHKSAENFVDSDGNPFAEPSRIQGNLQNGYGYFGGHTNSYIEIALDQ